MEEDNAQKSTKRCTKCKRELPTEAFYHNIRTTDGLSSWCRECTDMKNKESRLLRKEAEKTKQRILRSVAPRELMDELKRRGYQGELVFKEVKQYKIKL